MRLMCGIVLGSPALTISLDFKDVKPGDVIAFCRRDRGGFHEKDLSSNGGSVGSSEHRWLRAIHGQG
jgi:hypothetical protein